MAPIISTMVAMVLSLMAVTGLLNWAKLGADNVVNAATAAQFIVFNKAVSQYVEDNGNSLVLAATSTTPVTITVATLKAGPTSYLPAGFAGTNPFQQTWQAQVLQPSAGQLQTLVTSTGGQAISDPKQLISIAAQAGGGGWFHPLQYDVGKPGLRCDFCCRVLRRLDVAYGQLHEPRGWTSCRLARNREHGYQQRLSLSSRRCRTS